MNIIAYARQRKAAHITSALTLGLLLGAAPFQDAVAAQSSSAQATDAANKGSEEVLAEVVITGSLVRGVAPTGSNVVALDETDMKAVGAQNVAQLLGTMPQLSQFGQVQQAPLQNTVLGTGRTSYRPTVRQLPLGNVSPVLTMLDGHALVGAGFQQTDADPGLIPVGAIERVEVVLDGGSSLYGANAIGGVMNFITKTKMDGVSFNGDFGGVGGSKYRSGSFNLTGGTSWSGGGGLLSVYFRENTNLANSERPLPRQDLRDYGFADYRVRNCSPGNVIIGTTTYAIPALQPNTLNLCDSGLGQDTASKEKQWGLFGSVSQTLSDNLDWNLKVMAADRYTKPRGFALSELSAVIDPTNPFFRRIGTETRQQVAFNYAPVAGDSVFYNLDLKGYDATSTLTWRMASGWRTVAVVSYGRTNTTVFTPSINTTASAAALAGPGLTTATALNPYDLLQTNPAVIAKILDFRTQAGNVQTQTSARAIADGNLFSMPGGMAKGAFGLQFLSQGTDGYQVTGVNNSLAGGRFGNFRRKTLSAFGQLFLPIVSAGQDMRFVRSLDADLSARYDRYDTVGGTTNPRLGLSWGVTEGLKIRGAWATAYTAPTVVDETPTGSADANINIVQTGTNGALLLAGDSTSNLTRPSLAVGGAIPGTQKPQDAKTWSVGFDFNPVGRFQGFDLSGTIWRVDMTNTLVNGCPGTTLEQVANPTPGCSLRNPTLAQVQTFLPPGLPVRGLATSVEALYAAGTPPYLLQSSLRQNGGGFKTQGYDFKVGYRHQTGWGSYYTSLAGTKFLMRKTKASPTAAFTQAMVNFPTFTAIANIGANFGPKWSTNVHYNFQNRYYVSNLTGRTFMPAWATTDLFFGYLVSDAAQVTLNVNNVTDSMPITVNASGGQYVAAAINLQSTVGRYYSLGLKVHF